MHSIDDHKNIDQDKALSELSADLEGLKARSAEYQARLRLADLVVITLICSDSRVSVPEQPVLLNLKDGSQKKMMMVALPTIGGGAPSKARLFQVIDEIVNWGVDPTKIKLLATQHGDSHEVELFDDDDPTNDEHRSCGLRNFFSVKRKEIAKIRITLSQWLDRYRKETEQPELIADQLSFDTILENAPNLHSMITELSHATHLPRRLILRAASRHHSDDMGDDGEFVRSKVFHDTRSHVLFPTLDLWSANYDHQTKVLYFPFEHAAPDLEGGLPSLIPLTQLPQRKDAIQDPKVAIVSFGPQAMAVHSSILFPRLTGVEQNATADTVFRCFAAQPTPEVLLGALSAAAYALHYRIHNVGKPGENFAHLQALFIVCDNDQFVHMVKQTIVSAEFKNDFLPMFKELGWSELQVVNLNVDEDREPEILNLTLPD